MSNKNRLLTEEEFKIAVKWSMVEIILNNPEYKEGGYSKELEELAYSLPKEEK